MSGRRIGVELDRDEARLLGVLVDGDYVHELRDVLERLVHHAVDGVRRPGAWERDWLVQCFGPDFLARLEPDPETGYTDRPRRAPRVDERLEDGDDPIGLHAE